MESGQVDTAAEKCQNILKVFFFFFFFFFLFFVFCFLFFVFFFFFLSFKYSPLPQDDHALWDKWIYTFSSNRQLKSISKYIPIEKPTLEVCYHQNEKGRLC